jgi:hypothetical protein
MTLATEQPDTPAPEPEHPHEHAAFGEQWASNERMRHIPPLPWLAQKLDGDLRRRVELLLNLYSGQPELEKEFRGLCRCIDRIADVAKRTRGVQHHPPTEVPARLRWAINHTVSVLNAADGDTFGRRFPFQTFERSNAEPLWAAMLSAIHHLHRLTDLVRAVDPGIDERIYEGLVTLQLLLDPRPLA